VGIGERIREARQARKLSQEALALEIDVTQGAVGMYERGANLPSVETLPRLAAALGVSADWLLGMDQQRLAGVQKEQRQMRDAEFIAELAAIVALHGLSEAQMRLLLATAREFSKSP
jgi:hypothetical protein